MGRLASFQPKSVLGLTPYSFANCKRVSRDLKLIERIFCPMDTGAAMALEMDGDGRCGSVSALEQ